MGKCYKQGYYELVFLPLFLLQKQIWLTYPERKGIINNALQKIGMYRRLFVSVGN